MSKKATWIIPGLLVTLLLGLLWALPTLAAPSSDDNTIVLSGGADGDGLFYSDQTGFNIATATVEDTDLSSQRTGVARITNVGAAVTSFNLTAASSIIEGELGESETFTATAGQILFTLAKTPRDADADGALEQNVDDVQVVQNGTALVTADYTIDYAAGTVSLTTGATLGDTITITYESSEYDTTTPANTPLAGAASHTVQFGPSIANPTAFDNLINSVLVFGATTSTGVLNTASTPATVSGDEVKITFKYDVRETVDNLVTFSTPSLGNRGLTRQIDGVEALPASSAIFTAKVGLLSGADFDKIADVNGSTTYTGTATSANGAGTLLTDTAADFTTGEDPIGQTVTNITDGSSCFVTAKTTTTVTCAAGLAGGTGNDWAISDSYKIEVDTIDSVEAFSTITGTDLGMRIAAMAPDLGFATTGTPGLDQDETGSGDALVAILVPVADGEVLSSSYLDGTTTRTDTADMDLKAPTLNVVGPADGAYTNTTAQILTLEVTDELSAGGKASGLSVSEVDQLVFQGSGVPDTGPSLVPLLIATNSFRVARSVTFLSADEGKITWWVPTKDNVGNVPSSSVTGTAGEPVVLNLDLAPPNPITNAVKTGGAIDTRLTILPTGSHTAVGSSTTVLTDSAADFTGDGVKAGDKVTNVTDDATCTVGTPVLANVITCSAALSGGASFDQSDNYKIENPELGNVEEDGTALNFAHVQFDLGTGQAPIDPATVQKEDFSLIGSTIVNATVDKDGNKILFELGADLNTAAKPKFEMPGVVKDLSNNQMAVITSTNAITALDKLAPIINFNTSDIVGDAASQPASRGTVTIDFSAGEAASSTPTVTAAYLVFDGTNGTLTEGTVKILSVSSTGINSWRATVAITDILGASTAGLVNVRISLSDSSGNAASAGILDPDGTTTANAGVIDSDARVFEFDHRLNGGVSAVVDVFVVSPNTGTTAAPTTDVGNPFITVNFDNTTGAGGENAEYAVGGIAVDTHDNVTITSAIWTNPDGSTVDVLSLLNQADDNSYVFAPRGLPEGTHTFTVQAHDEVGNVSTSIGSATPTSFTLTLVVTERATYKVPLKPGANFFSIPATPSVDDVNQIIGNDVGIDVILTYDNATGLWLVASRDTDPESPTFGLLVGTLGTIDAEHAYWVVTDRFQNLEFQLPRTTAGTAVLPTVILVFKGWNAVPVGDPSQAVAGTPIDPDTYFAGLSWSAAVFYDPARPAFIKTAPGGTCTVVPAPPGAVPVHPCLQNGLGVFVFVTADGVIIP